MDLKKKPAIRVALTDATKELADKLARELEGGNCDGHSATGWTDPYRASGVKHGGSG